MRQTPEQPIPQISLIALISITLLTAACGETLLAEGGSYCTPSAEQRSEDCYLNDGEPVVVDDVSDLDPICSTSCNKIRELRISGRNVAGLTNLEALRGISVESVDFTGVPDLRTTRGLSLAQGAGIRLGLNPSLREFAIEEPLTKITHVIIEANSSLVSLDALSEITHETSSQFHLMDIPVRDLDFLDGMKLTSGAYFQIRNLDNVTEVPELSGEATFIQIEENDSLKDVSGLAGIDRIFGSFTVLGNPNVKNCAADEVAQQITFHDRARINIRENGTGSCE